MNARAYHAGCRAALESFGFAKAADALAPPDATSIQARKSNISQQWDNLWKTGEIAPPGQLPLVTAPPAPKAVSAAQPATKLGLPKMKPPSFTPPAPPAPPAAKLAEWRLRPRPSLRPGQIHPDNGEQVLRTNFDLRGKGGISPKVNQAFNSLSAQRNSDASDPLTLNDKNESTIPPVGV